jgi:hypothetical protein
MKIFFESYDLFVQMFTPLVGIELEVIIGGRADRLTITKFDNTNGVFGFDVTYADSGSQSIIPFFKVWEIHVP